ncbi:serine hydrolase domain-containing protein, partial [Peribacillus sp. NPDC056705]|uniref:serine hydrolase domain-containing protein n=1 Tax=Peribacillus sp. NPDC056705 TaxID=3345918 RepID=UPI00374A78BC
GLSFRGLHAACTAIERELQAGTMPGAVLGVLYQERQWMYAAGYADPKQAHASPLSASEETLYDCASLTKVTVTLPLILRLIDEGMLTLSTRVSDILPSFGQLGKEEVTVGQLLTHTSGLQADMNLHAHGWTREQMWDALYAAPLVTKTGTEVIYSDIVFLVLGRLIETLLQMPLDEAADSMIFEPLGMNSATFRPLARQAACAATEYDDATKGHLSGVVHDEKARALGGACGHAGLFATASDLLRYARMWLRYGLAPSDGAAEATGGPLRVVSQAAVRHAIRCHTAPIPEAYRGLGWVLKGDKMDASGDWMSPRCYGHTGFTGTSLFIDPDHELAVVLLTNRVYGGRNTSVASLRARVHNALTAAVSG